MRVLFRSQDANDRRLHEREGAPRAGVEQQRLVVEDQVLVEAEAAGHGARRHRYADAVDAVGDFVDAGVVRGRHGGPPEKTGSISPARDCLGACGCRMTRIQTSVMLRSEEHTSELQSLMRNSYAVFCLKKKKL